MTLGDFAAAAMRNARVSGIYVPDWVLDSWIIWICPKELRERVLLRGKDR